LEKKSKNKKIDFLIIGTQKSGTSVLDEYLRQHPEIGMAKRKELHYFDNEIVFSNREVDYSIYEKEFEFSQNFKVYGESTPIYLYWEPSCKRIWEYNKDIKLITLLRNPIDRAFSHWNMEYDRNAEKEPFLYCIKNESFRIKEALPAQHRVYSYIDRGFYSEQIRRYKKYFNDDQLLFIKYEEFKKNQEIELNKVFEFLNVNPNNYNYNSKIVHKINYQNEMNAEERNYLKAVFQNEILEVERLLNWNCQDWMK
jgi:hypothetical protein